MATVNIAQACLSVSRALAPTGDLGYAVAIATVVPSSPLSTLKCSRMLSNVDDKAPESASTPVFAAPSCSVQAHTGAGSTESRPSQNPERPCRGEFRTSGVRAIALSGIVVIRPCSVVCRHMWLSDELARHQVRQASNLSGCVCLQHQYEQQCHAVRHSLVRGRCN